MINYLFENHIYFFLYLSPLEINKLASLNKKIVEYFSNDIWYLVLVKQSQFPKNLKCSTSISFFHRPNNVTSIGNNIKTKNKHLYQYLALANDIYRPSVRKI